MKTIKFSGTKMFAVVSAFLMVTIVASCGKDGDIGPKGDTGLQGIPGKEGAVILSGMGAPASANGNNGDMYLDKSTNNLYGPKSATGWGIPLNLKGEAGASGSVILNGTTVPTTVGNNGDYYLNKTNADLYGPKTAAGWGTPINLKGSANVISSTWINLKTWNGSVTNYIREVSYEIPSPILNAIGYNTLGAMLEKGGTMMVYFYYNTWAYQTPVTISSISDNSYQARWYIAANPFTNKFNFQVRGVNDTALPTAIVSTPDNGNYKLRYVLIPAGTQLSATANLKSMNYEQMKGLLKLKDE